MITSLSLSERKRDNSSWWWSGSKPASALSLSSRENAGKKVNDYRDDYAMPPRQHAQQKSQRQRKFKTAAHNEEAQRNERLIECANIQKCIALPWAGAKAEAQKKRQLNGVCRQIFKITRTEVVDEKNPPHIQRDGGGGEVSRLKTMAAYTAEEKQF